MEAISPREPYAKGVVLNGGGFLLKGGIVGTLPLKPPGAPGWIEFPTLHRHNMQEAVAPQQPYLTGTFTGDGGFYPDRTPDDKR